METTGPSCWTGRGDCGSPHGQATIHPGRSASFRKGIHMFSHIMIGARELEAMVAFYDVVLATLDLHRVVELDDIDEAGVIWCKGKRRWPQFALRRPINGLPATACKLVSQHHRERPSTLPGLQRSGRAHLMKGRLVNGHSTRTIFTPLTVAILRETNSVLSLRTAFRPNCQFDRNGYGPQQPINRSVWRGIGRPCVVV